MSLRCPKCGAKAACNNSRRRANGSVNRTFICAKGHRFSSIEVIVRIGRGKSHLRIGGNLSSDLSARLLAEAKEEIKKRILAAFEDPIVSKA